MDKTCFSQGCKVGLPEVDLLGGLQTRDHSGSHQNDGKIAAPTYATRSPVLAATSVGLMEYAPVILLLLGSPFNKWVHVIMCYT